MIKYRNFCNNFFSPHFAPNSRVEIFKVLKDEAPILFEELVKALVEEGADPERRDISANTSDILGSLFFK